MIFFLAPQLGINPLQTRAVFHAADLNNDGVLSREELNNIADFKHADLNHDGRVDPLEMQIYRNKAMIGLGPSKFSYYFILNNMPFFFYYSTTTWSC